MLSVSNQRADFVRHISATRQINVVKVDTPRNFDDKYWARTELNMHDSHEQNANEEVVLSKK